MIKQFPNEAKDSLLQFYNYIWQEGFIPSCWKQAQVSAIPKPGKPSKDPTSYRPISLTPHCCKLFERLVSNRLDYFIERQNILPDCQTGFRRGRSCTENLTKLSSHVKRAMMKRRPVMAAFFDVKRAFDTVWHNGLLDKLYQIGVSQNIYNFFKSFLSDRKLVVKVGGQTSDPHSLDMGIPQGSIVAPTAFSLMLCDISFIELKNASISLYADDLALWSTSERYRKTYTERFTKSELKIFQENVDKISNYMFYNGFVLSPNKTVFMIFSSSSRINKDAFIVIDDNQLFPSDEVKYLGVILDKGFTFKSHIDSLITKTRKNLNLIRLLKREEGVDNIQNLRQLILSLVRSRLRYGEEIFCSASPSLLKRLQECETSIIKQILNLPKHADPLLVYREIGLTPLSLCRCSQTTKTVFRLGTSDNDLDQELNFDFNNCRNSGALHRLRARPKQLSRAISVTNYVEPIIQEAEIGNLNVKSVSNNRFFCRPWEETHMDISDSLGDVKKSEDPLLLATLTNELLEDHSDFIQIFTDGSIKDEKAGCAFVAPGLAHTEKFKLNDGISIFSAELYALEKALDFAANIDYNNILILSDSKSVIQTMKHQNSNKLNFALQLMHKIVKQGKCVKIQWIPSHVGITGNELADSAAKAAVEDPNLPMTNIDYTLSEICSKIKQAEERIWLKEFSSTAKDKSWCEANSINCQPFVSSREEHTIFLKLRCKTTRYEMIRTMCSCSNEILTVPHIFICKHLSSQFQKTLLFCYQHEISFNYVNIMSFHSSYGYRLTKIFIQDLLASDIGHLV